MQNLMNLLNGLREHWLFYFLKEPFFTLGDFHISVWLLFKAAILFYLFLAAAKFLNRFLDRHVYPRLGLEESAQYTLSIIIKYLFIAVGGVTVLYLLGINMNAFAVVAGTLGIGIGFGLQDIAKNFVSGLVILIERPIKVGDYIEVGGLPGRVRAIEARGTVVDTFDNTSVIVPNSEFISQRVVNWSHSDRIIRIQIPVGVAYGSDTRLVEKTLLEVAKEHPKILESPKSSVLFEGFGDSSLNFVLMGWCKEPQNRFMIKSQINFMIDDKFRERGITIPFPQRDLHFKSTQISLGNEKQ